MGNTELRRLSIDSNYLISSDGLIWKRMKGRPRYNKNNKSVSYHILYENNWYRFLRPFVGGKYKNYLRVEINKKSFFVHRLVLLTFNPIENSENYEVNHIDRNTFNNNVDNLEWCSTKENIAHFYNTKRELSYEDLRLKWEEELTIKLNNLSQKYNPKVTGSWCIKYDTDTIVELLKTTSLSLKEIANKVDAPLTSVKYWAEKLKKEGVIRPKKNTLKNKIEELLHLNPNLSAKAIAETLGVRVTSVHSVLRQRKV